MKRHFLDLRPKPISKLRKIVKPSFLRKIYWKPVKSPAIPLSFFFRFVISPPLSTSVRAYNYYTMPIINKRTKIVATVGPACNKKEQLLALVEAGADVFRLNFSHGSYE